MLWPTTVRDWWQWDPLREMRRVQRELERALAGSAPGHVPQVFPPVNIWTGRDDVVVTAEVPGVEPQKLEISVVGDTLTLSGEREGAEAEEGQVVNRLERETGAFARTVQLPFRVEADKAEATYAKGILRIKLPRLEADKPKQIAIKASN